MISCQIFELKLQEFFNWVTDAGCPGFAISKKNPPPNPYHCDPSPHLQESPGPPGPKSQKSLKKGLFGGSGEKSQKYPKKSKNTDFRTVWGISSVFLDYFGHLFLRLFLQTPKKTLFETFCDFGPGGPANACKWRLGSQRAYHHGQQNRYSPQLILRQFISDCSYSLGRVQKQLMSQLQHQLGLPENSESRN